VDCHLPNDNLINHLIWKGIDGTKDVVSFYGRLYPDLIKISEHGKKTVKENCIRCHDEMVSRMKVEGKDCWTCHRQTTHTYPGRGIGD
jgi:cytochrome c nitrite reductase small subunit